MRWHVLSTRCCARRRTGSWPVRGMMSAPDEKEAARGSCGAHAWLSLLESPQRFGSADDGGQLNGTEVAAIEGEGFVPIHEEDLALFDHSTPMPDRQWAATPIVCERHAHLDPIDANGTLVPAY